MLGFSNNVEKVAIFLFFVDERVNVVVFNACWSSLEGGSLILLFEFGIDDKRRLFIVAADNCSPLDGCDFKSFSSS